MSKKSCSRCGHEKPLCDFYRAQSAKDGHQGACKECDKERVAEWRAAHRERANDTIRRSAYKYWDKTLARARVRKRVYRGTLKKPEACENCGGKVSDPKFLHAHHEDYSKPLEIEWLCPKCHAHRDAAYV